MAYICGRPAGLLSILTGRFAFPRNASGHKFYERRHLQMSQQLNIDKHFKTAHAQHAWVWAALSARWREAEQRAANAQDDTDRAIWLGKADALTDVLLLLAGGEGAS